MSDTTKIVPFVFSHDQEETPIRVVTVSGEPWFVAVDCCRVLGLANPTEAIKPLDPDEKDTLRISEGTSGNPTHSIISEPGLYRLIQRSSKPAAKRFDRFVRHEILPSIRKTGRYVIPSAAPEPDLLAALNTITTDIREIKGDIAGLKRKVGDWRENFSIDAIRYFGEGVAKHNNCECIYCNETVVVTRYGERLDNCHAHHANGNRADTSAENCTLPCVKCHARLTNKKHPDHIPAYRALGIAETFHLKLKQKAGQIRPPNPTATKFWDFRPAVQADLASDWPHAYKRPAAAE